MICNMYCFFFFKQKTAYEMRISDWSSDVCSSDLYQTTQAVMGAMQGIAQYNRPDDYVQTLKSRIEGQSDASVEAAAKEIIHPNQLTWVIVGDLDRKSVV